MLADCSCNAMKRLYSYFFRGLITFLPLALTVYLLYVFVVWVESLAMRMVRPITGDFYLPGLGIVLGAALILALGVLVSQRYVAKALSWLELPFTNLPVIKSVYSSLKNFADYFAPHEKDSQQVVLLRKPGDDMSIVGGLARFNGQACMVLGHQKGRDTKERGLRNFGMSRPEGYRKALRLMKTAEKFKLPVFTFVDTPGAYPGIDAEERGQSEAIGRNIFEMAQLEVPIITTIIGEGGSGGALAISVADQVIMLQYSVYSVISPEGCASILWKTADQAQAAAEALGITAHRLKALGLIDKIVNEPVGGAHRDPKQMAAFLKRALGEALRQVSDLKVKELLERRYERLQGYGRYTDTKAEAR